MTGEVTIISRTHRKVNGNYYARVRYKIDDGRPLDILRRVENKFAIKPKQAEIEVELLQHGPAQLPSILMVLWVPPVSTKNVNDQCHRRRSSVLSFLRK